MGTHRHSGTLSIAGRPERSGTGTSRWEARHHQNSPVTWDNPVTSDVLTATAVSTRTRNNCQAGSTDPACTPVTQGCFPP